MTDPTDADVAWCQAFLVEAERVGAWHDELWEELAILVRDPVLRALPPAAAVEHWRTNG